MPRDRYRFNGAHTRGRLIGFNTPPILRLTVGRFWAAIFPPVALLHPPAISSEAPANDFIASCGLIDFGSVGGWAVARQSLLIGCVADWQCWQSAAAILPILLTLPISLAQSFAAILGCPRWHW